MPIARAHRHHRGVPEHTRDDGAQCRALSGPLCLTRPTPISLDAPVIRMLVRQEHGLEMDDTDAENLQSFNDQQLRAFNSFNVVHMPSCLED